MPEIFTDAYLLFTFVFKQALKFLLLMFFNCNFVSVPIFLQ